MDSSTIYRRFYLSFGIVAFLGVGCAQTNVPCVTAFGQPIRWLAPSGISADRMRISYATSSDSELYASISDRHSEITLVALKRSSLITFGDIYGVEIIDRRGHLLKRGILHCQKSEVPYCLLEVYTATTDLPDQYRNRWILAIGLMSVASASRFNPSFPFCFYAGSILDDAKMNLLDVEPVEWLQDYPYIKHGVGILGEAGEVRCRLAESAWKGLVQQCGPMKYDTDRGPINENRTGVVDHGETYVIVPIPPRPPAAAR